jgi:hypothetical protein
MHLVPRLSFRGGRNGLSSCRGNQGLVSTFSELTPDAVSQQQRILVMLKTLALSASVLAFAGGLALAEAPMAREPSTGRSVATSSLSTDHWLASDVYKADVYDPFDHKIGTPPSRRPAIRRQGTRRATPLVRRSLNDVAWAKRCPMTEP